MDVIHINILHYLERNVNNFHIMLPYEKIEEIFII
jgi:hypothetical protein